MLGRPLGYPSGSLSPLAPLASIRWQIPRKPGSTADPGQAGAPEMLPMLGFQSGARIMISDQRSPLRGIREIWGQATGRLPPANLKPKEALIKDIARHCSPHSVWRGARRGESG